jgi:CubicO group peptidase (beta-lactamase class C family)
MLFRPLVWFCFMGLYGCSLLAAPPAEPGIDAREIPVRDFLKAKAIFESFIFYGDRFPSLRLDPAQAVKGFLGDYQLKTTFYDSKLKAVTAPKKAGAYAAVIEIAPARGRSTHRLVTLYRLAEPVSAYEVFDESKLSDLSRITGISSRQLLRQSNLVTNTFKARLWDEITRDPRAARLLAGLSLSPHGHQPVRRNQDAFAMERQWWLDLKRRVTGAEKLFAKKVAAPDRISGKPAQMVHEGTLAEAGMKPDAADKIDATLQAWAADSDEAFAVCIVRHGVIVLHKAYGTRDGQPMTVTNKSWMASVTKTMSACQMMMLIDRGLVGLDDPIEKFLPQLRGLSVENPITIRHLYTHTSGLDKWPAWSDEAADVEEQLADCYPFIKVGKAWAYNGQGYTTGGKIIEMISGEAIPHFYLHHFLEPLGCPNTDVIATHADMMTTPLDMARFGQMLLNRGAYGKNRFFRPETFDQMLPQKLTRVLGPEATKTFGIGLDGAPGSGRYGHGTASAATFNFDFDADMVVIMCRNAMGKNWDKYNGKFWEALKRGIASPESK